MPRILSNTLFAYRTIGLRFALRYLAHARRSDVSILDAWRGRVR